MPLRITQSFDYLKYKGHNSLDAALEPIKSPEALFQSGNWSWGWTTATESKDGLDRLGLRWDGVTAGVRIRSGSLEFRGRDSGDSFWGVELSGGVFPPTDSGCLQSTLCETGYYMDAVLVLDVEFEEVQLPAVHDPETAQCFAMLTTQPNPHNVLLDFPRSGHKIYTSELVLRRTPYFATLLSSGFSEQAGRDSGMPDDVTGPTSFDDSDDEDDGASPSSAPSSSPPPHDRLITVRITETSSRTYLAVICWLQTGYVDYAPLTSSFLSSAADLTQARLLGRDAVSISGSPSALSRVSAKSVYRLADLLELPLLQASALANFRSQLTPSVVATELFSDFARLYDEPCAVLFDYVAKERKKVFETEEMNKRIARADGEEADGKEAAVWAKLARRLLNDG
ncbi:hypothetical protein JCM10213_004890 [Rhodosporidiobolus nylandii]